MASNRRKALLLREGHASVVKASRLPPLICLASFEIKISRPIVKRAVISRINVRRLICATVEFNASTNARNEGDSTSDNSKLLDTMTLRVYLRILSPVPELYFLKKRQEFQAVAASSVDAPQ
jgi:hypothetical protein